MSHCVLIAAGGTGGHVFPGIALADALVAKADVTPVFVGTPRGFEQSVVPERGYPIEIFDLTAINGVGAAQAIRGVANAGWSLARALRVVRSRAPRVLISIGGYAAGPVALAAVALGVPVAVVEPNSVMGLSNRLIAPIARRIYVGWEHVRPDFGRAEIRHYGIPLRPGFRPRLYESSATRRVLVLGGSQGAQPLNERVPEALGRLGIADLEVLHQSGDGREGAVREAYARAQVPRARVIPFSTQLDDELAWADLVIARAGAGTVAEIAAVGRASLLIPYPHAADDHQAKNAEAYAGAGAAICVRQSAADSTRIALEVGRVLEDGALRAQLATRARSLGRPEATARIADDVLQLARIPARGEIRKSVASVTAPEAARAR